MPPRKKQAADDSISLNKYISDTGFCSRREADEYIAQGRLTINDEPAVSGNRVHEGDVVELDGEPLVKKVKPFYIAFHKPRGVTSTTDERDKTNIVSYINHPKRIFPIGRLDKDSEGLIFLTNDGNIVNKILRAGNNHEKEYVVTTEQAITPEFIQQMSAGVRIPDGKTKPCKVKQEAKNMFRITLTQGLNRQIRKMAQALDFRVIKLKRVRIMNVHLANLPSGHWRYLNEEEIATIMKLTAESTASPKASRPPATELRRGVSKDDAQTGRTAPPAKKKVTATKPGLKKTGEKEKAKTKSYKEYRKKK